MTLHKDQDPGWWRRGMTKRAQVIIVTIALVTLTIAAIVIAVNGIALF